MNAVDRAEALKERTKTFALRVVSFSQRLPNHDAGRIIGRQVLRAATSVAANYRAVCKARSRAEFVAKLGLVAEEADEVVFWLTLLIEARFGIVEAEPLLVEAKELMAIFAASYRTARANARRMRQ